MASLPHVWHLASHLVATAVVTVALLASHPAAAEPPTPQAHRRLADEMERNLWEHVLAKWYPVAVDATGRGFIQNYDEAWRAEDDGTRGLVYQSRLTWLSAQVAMAYPDKADEFAGYSRHGLAFLRDGLWDAEHGGLFWGVKADGSPVSGGEKHVYGIAFAIYAASANYAATRDAEALRLAQDAFRWLDEHAHDAEHGGYYEALTRAGAPILAPFGTSDDETHDHIGTRYGLKSMNSHIHLLEAFSSLYEVWPDPAVRSRLEEVFDVVRHKVLVEEVGALNLYFTPAWRAIPAVDSYGHDVETAFLLVEAAEALGRHDDPDILRVARTIVDHGLQAGWDVEHGGFYDDGKTFGPALETVKIWWVQAEGLNALVLMHRHFGGETQQYWDALRQQWAFITEHQVDAEHGGWRPAVTAEGRATAGQDKSDGWTEAYHQGRALLTSLRTLRAMAESGSAGEKP